MCGIAGWLGRASIGDPAPVGLQMAAAIAHRGPDDCGVWASTACDVVLAHRRLSIVDLSAAGHQPMASSCNRYVLVFNGEIYNHLDLRQELNRQDPGLEWRGHSDTETLLAAFVAWGIERTLQAAVGMFALALWDESEGRLTLARDRMGEKPLYFGRQNGLVLFGSEMKALRAHPSFSACVDRNALALMLRFNCIPAPYSIYEGIQKLMPGHYLTLDANAGSVDELPPSRPYWRFNEVVEFGLANQFVGSDREATDALEKVLLRSVQSQMVADVPLGAFLSGGIDSSVVVALMQVQSQEPVRTFTIGFESEQYDEATHAKAVAKHLGTFHTELYVSPADALAVIPTLATTYCEPFSDSSQIPALLVSSLASRQVKVALSGDAGDELFAGYNRYLMAEAVWRKVRRLPRPGRQALARLINAKSPAGWDAAFAGFGRALPRRFQVRTPGDKMHKLAGVMSEPDDASFYRRLVSQWQNPESIVCRGHEPTTLLSRREDWPRTENFVQWMMAMDAQTYLPDDILTKVDRAAMAHSLETRVPFLDHRVVEFAWRIPQGMKVRKGEGKWLLRQVLDRHVPRALIDRPKMGFGVPLHDWLRGPLREWAEELLSPDRLRREGYFNPEPITELWRAHLSGRINAQHTLWVVLMFQAWLAEQ